MADRAKKKVAIYLLVPKLMMRRGESLAQSSAPDLPQTQNTT